MISDSAHRPPAALVIKVRGISDPLTLELEDANGRSRYQGSFKASGVAKWIQDSLPEYIRKADGAARSGSSDPTELPLNLADGALKEAGRFLEDISRSLVYEVFGRKSDVLLKLGKEILDHRDRDDEDAPIAPIVEISAPGCFYFPFELMAWARPDEDPEISAKDRLRSSLLGMSAVMYRTISDAESSTGDPRLDAGGRLPTTIVHEWDGTDIGYLITDLRDTIQPHGPFPSPNCTLPADAVVRHLLDPKRPIEGVDRLDVPSSVVYLQGHSDTTDKNADSHYFSYGRETSNVADRFTLKALTDGVFYGWGSGASNLPLVFMNSCASTGLQSHNLSSFAGFFQENGHRGFIGTLGVVYHSTAADFAKTFFRELLQAKPVGQAIFEARQHLLDVHNNPFGILYAYYGASELRFADPKTGKLVPTGCQSER